MRKIREVWNSQAGFWWFIIPILSIAFGLFYWTIATIEPVHASFTLVNGQVINGIYDGGGSLFGMTIHEKSGNRHFYEYKDIDKYCLYLRSGIECGTIDHIPSRWPSD